MTGGWVRNWRQIEDWEWYTTPNMAHLFQHLIRRANHKSRRWQGVKINTGQLVTSQESLRLQTGLSRQSIRTSLERLKSTNDITIETTSTYSLVSICNYSSYQANGDDSNQPCNQVSNQRATSEQPAANQRATTNKNEKKDKTIKNKQEYTPDFLKFWQAYPRKEGKGKAWESWQKKNPPIEQVLATVARYKLTPSWLPDANGQTWIPHPTTWLNQNRWEDEPNVGKQKETTAEAMERIKREGRIK